MGPARRSAHCSGAAERTAMSSPALRRLAGGRQLGLADVPVIRLEEIKMRKFESYRPSHASDRAFQRFGRCVSNPSPLAPANCDFDLVPDATVLHELGAPLGSISPCAAPVVQAGQGVGDCGRGRGELGSGARGCALLVLWQCMQIQNNSGLPQGPAGASAPP